MQNVFDKILTFQPVCVYVGEKRGWWKKGKYENKAEKVMMIISELSEMLDADRKDKWIPISLNTDPEHTKMLEDMRKHREDNSLPNPVRMEILRIFAMLYEEAMKGFVQEEMADVIIRILGYCANFDRPLIYREYRKLPTDNFGHDLLRITKYCLDAYYSDDDVDHGGTAPMSYGKDWGYVIASLISLASWYGVDLAFQVECKLLYTEGTIDQHKKY